MKTLTIYFIFIIVSAQLVANEVLVSVGSVHSQSLAETSKYEYNNFNYGIGYKHNLTNIWSMAGGYYKNSYREDTTYVAGEAMVPVIENIGVGVLTGMVSGYPRSEAEYKGWAPMIGGEIEYKLTENIKMVVIGTDTHLFDVPDSVAVAHFQLRYKF